MFEGAIIFVKPTRQLINSGTATIKFPGLSIRTDESLPGRSPLCITVASEISL